MARQNRRDIFDPNQVGCLDSVHRTVRLAWLCGNAKQEREAGYRQGVSWDEFRGLVETAGLDRQRLSHGQLVNT